MSPPLAHRSRPSAWLRYAIAALALFVGVARASCIPSSDPRLAPYDALMRASPAVVEQRVTEVLQAGVDLDPMYRASLYEILAQAYSLQERHSDVRRAVSEGLALVKDHSSAAYINLVYLDATRSVEANEIQPALARAEASLKLTPTGSPYEACALITLGLLEHFADRTDLASIYLTRAYRMSKGAERKQQRIAAAGVLASVLQLLRDYPQALAMVREVIEDARERNSLMELSSGYFVEGYILTELGDNARARVSLERSRELGVKLNDTIGVAYSDINLCTNHISAKEMAEASAHCRDALRVFTAANSVEPRKQALTGLAEIALHDRKPQEALAILDEVLEHNGRDLPPFRLAHIYELRGEAHRDLGQYRAALDDYEEFMRRFKANKEDERAREAGALRARFETDRQIERNEFLQRELSNKSESLAAQSERLRWMLVAAVACVGGMVLLTFLLVANRKKKRLLARLAQEDELTGLPNRRFTLAKARDAFESLRGSDAPLTIGILDLDHFKRINDRLGHASGDYVLKEFARLSRDKIRDTDILGRWGGEEFLIVLPNTPLDIALSVLERIRTQAAEIRGEPLPADFSVSVSVGLATSEARAATLEEIIAHADRALYEAKHRGRNRIEIAQKSYDAASVNVRRTLKQNGVDLATGKFVA